MQGAIHSLLLTLAFFHQTKKKEFTYAGVQKKPILKVAELWPYE